jgi:hypothetical protein
MPLLRPRCSTSAQPSSVPLTHCDKWVNQSSLWEHLVLHHGPLPSAFVALVASPEGTHNFQFGTQFR